jgi:hypothetical protein
VVLGSSVNFAVCTREVPPATDGFTDWRNAITDPTALAMWITRPEPNRAKFSAEIQPHQQRIVHWLPLIPHPPSSRNEPQPGIQSAIASSLPARTSNSIAAPPCPGAGCPIHAVSSHEWAIAQSAIRFAQSHIFTSCQKSRRLSISESAQSLSPARIQQCNGDCRLLKALFSFSEGAHDFSPAKNSVSTRGFSPSASFRRPQKSSFRGPFYQRGSRRNCFFRTPA